jgi:hypothetical protein
MKNIKLPKVLVLLYCLLLMACKTNEPIPDDSVENQRIWILSDFEKYEKLMKGRAKYEGGATFEITDLQRKGNMLKISVEGGCLADEYKAYCDGKIELTEPVTANIVLNLEPTKGLNCITVFKGIVEIDMLKLIGKEYDPNLRVKVSNSTKVVDKIIDKNGMVTTKN